MVALLFFNIIQNTNNPRIFQRKYQFLISFYFQKEVKNQLATENYIRGGGGLPYETDRDARRLDLGCKLWISVSLRVFWAKHQYFMPPRSGLGFRKETQNYAGLVFFQRLCLYIIKTHCMSSLLGVKSCLSHAQIGLLQGSQNA